MGDEYGYARESFNRTAISAIASGVRWVNPWIWLGGGAKLIVENYAARFDDFRWNYPTINSWSAPSALRSCRRMASSPHG